MDTQSELSSSKEIILYLSKQFPNCFFIEGEAKPLKIGIFQDLGVRLVNDEKVSKTKLRMALRSYTMSWRYLYSIKEGASRVDLDGNPCELITQQHVEHAQQQLKESKEKVKAKRIAEGKVNQTSKSSRKSPASIPQLDRPQQKVMTKDKTVKSVPVKPISIKQKTKTDISQLKIGDKVNVVLGSKPVSAIIVSIEKEHVKVKIPSGMELMVTSGHIVAS